MIPRDLTTLRKLANDLHKWANTTNRTLDEMARLQDDNARLSIDLEQAKLAWTELADWLDNWWHKLRTSPAATEQDMAAAEIYRVVREQMECFARTSKATVRNVAEISKENQ